MTDKPAENGRRLPTRLMDIVLGAIMTLLVAAVPVLIALWSDMKLVQYRLAQLEAKVEQVAGK